MPAEGEQPSESETNISKKGEEQNRLPASLNGAPRADKDRVRHPGLPELKKEKTS